MDTPGLAMLPALQRLMAVMQEAKESGITETAEYLELFEGVLAFQGLSTMVADAERLDVPQALAVGMAAGLRLARRRQEARALFEGGREP